MEKLLASIVTKGSKLGLSAVAFLSLAGYLGETSQYLELMSHFKVQYLVLALVFFLILTRHRTKSWVLIGLVTILVNAYEIIPLYFSSSAPKNDDTEIAFSLMLSNVQTSNTGHSKLVELVNKERPDILVAEEVDSLWTASLETLTALLPYKEIVSRNDNFGIAIYSRFPFDSVKALDLGSVGVPSIFTTITIAGKIVNILAVHPLPPIGMGSYSERNTQLSAMSTYIKRLPNYKIVIGDLNVTMWSPFFTKLIRESGLVNARRGHGVLASWPTHFPLMMIPIDHCLVSPEIHVNTMRLLINIGSDHLPIMVNLAI